METPVYDFVQEYVKKNSVRLHMPGHKGHSFVGCESLDITEIVGADVLSESMGILGASQRNAADLFGTGATFYSTEGSSLCIKTMLAEALMEWRRRQRNGVQHRENRGHEKKRPWILAARNVHRAMIDGCALLDLDVKFLPFTEKMKSICSTSVDGRYLEKHLSSCGELPIGVYITSPDYLGRQSDIAAIATVCHQYGLPLLVDNAHGAYLAFLGKSQHPMAAGADYCCDSAHKTLPVLTGGAYLHLSHSCVKRSGASVPKVMAMFGSTSPSYLVLQSLDLCNRYLAEDYMERLKECVRRIRQVKEAMMKRGFAVQKTEPLKLVIDTAASGYEGQEIAQEMRDFSYRGDVQGIECEYADNEFLVLMLTPENGEEDFQCLWEWMKVTRLNEKKESLFSRAEVCVRAGAQRMSIREAVLSDFEMVPVGQALGRVLAQETVSCPPAIPIGISGEEVTEEMVELFQTYGIGEIAVVACNI